MSAFTPTSFGVVAAVIGALAAVLAAGFAITRVRSIPLARGLAWSLVIGAVVLAELLTAAEPAGVRMVAIIGLLLYAMKPVVAVESGTRLSALRWLAFAALWPGMRPALFAKTSPAARSGAAELMVDGLVRMALGAALIALGRFVWSTTESRVAAAALILPGISLVLHFGLFNLATGGWRSAGVPADALFKAPLLATTLREFWGKRWNLAFSEMTALGIYRPVSSVAGRRVGMVAAFVASGIVHELAISLPVRAGFGLPLLYFGLHAVAMLAEGALGPTLERHPWLGRAWTVAWLVLPLPILFHPWFLDGVVWPLVGLGGP
jgi:hypothetical protein